MFLQFVLLQFHHGVQVAPIARGETGHFDPRRVLQTLYRVGRCNVDITDRWDYWPTDGDAVRGSESRLGLLPATRTADSRARAAEPVVVFA